jgi:hypothetical protein
LAIRHLQWAQVTTRVWLPLTFLQLGFVYISIATNLAKNLAVLVYKIVEKALIL